MGIQKEHTKQDKLHTQLSEILQANSDKRVIVVGTTCTGKSTLLKKIPGSEDMDEIVFPKLTKAEADYVCSEPWTEEIGRAMTRLVKERVKVEAGKPVFGTVVLDCDLIVYLKINDDLLRERTKLRNKDFNYAKNMQSQIEKGIKQSGIPAIELMF
jgi:broad-specificity NMP kinase